MNKSFPKSNSNLRKKLLPLRKALKNIKDNLQLKSYSSKIISNVHIARKRCVIFSQSISRLIYTTFRTLTDRPRLNSDHYHHSYRNFSVIYIDELFQGKTLLAEQVIKTKENMVPSSSTSYVENRSSHMIETTHDVPILQNHHVNIESSTNHEKGLPVGKRKTESNEISNNPASADKWKIPLLPQFRGIDERAEAFIEKFRQDMKLQREQPRQYLVFRVSQASFVVSHAEIILNWLTSTALNMTLRGFALAIPIHSSSVLVCPQFYESFLFFPHS